MNAQWLLGCGYTAILSVAVVFYNHYKLRSNKENTRKLYVYAIIIAGLWTIIVLSYKHHPGELLPLDPIGFK